MLTNISIKFRASYSQRLSHVGHRSFPGTRLRHRATHHTAGCAHHHARSTAGSHERSQMLQVKSVEPGAVLVAEKGKDPKDLSRVEFGTCVWTTGIKMAPITQQLIGKLPAGACTVRPPCIIRSHPPVSQGAGGLHRKTMYCIDHGWLVC